MRLVPALRTVLLLSVVFPVPAFDAEEEGLWPAPVAEWTAPTASEHPRLSFRRTDLPALREGAKTLEGEAMLEMQSLSASDAGSGSGPVAESAGAIRFDPVVQQMEGWTVHVDPSMLEGEHSDSGAAALKMLANHLQRIAILLPQEQLAKMRKLEIWIEHHHPTLASMQYHPSLDWLTSHGHDPRLARKVHIPRAQDLLSRRQMVKHPAVVLHELAHAYHDQYLGFDNPRIIEAYEKAKTAGIYEKVLLYDGRTVRHYALSNHKEYFAEGTEAYFYRNDFYPFCRAELRQHDPILHDLLVEIWGPLE